MKDEEKVLKQAGKETSHTTRIRMTTDFLSETESRRQQKDSFPTLKEKHQVTILSPLKSSLKRGGQTKTSSHKQKPREFVAADLHYKK